MIKLNTITENPTNPRFIDKDKFEQLKASIKEFPEMMKLRPIVIDDKRVVLGGNMRLKALLDMDYKEVPNGWIVSAKDLTEAQKKEFIIKDNVGFGAWDWDILANEWDELKLLDWGLELSWDKPTGDKPDLSNEFTDEFEVVVKCATEAEQEEVYNKLTGEGYECRVLTL